MSLRRFSVTVVVLLGTVISVGCSNKKKPKNSPDPVMVAALKAEANAKWEESDDLGEELHQRFHISIDEPNSKLMGQKFNWGRITLAERQLAKEKLARSVTLLSRMIEIDAKRGIYLTDMDKVRLRYEGSLSFQESLDRFEKVMGEQYEPKAPGQGQVYFAPVDI